MQLRIKGKNFTSFDVRLRSYNAKHNLAVVYRVMGRNEDAIVGWKIVLIKSPDFHPDRLGLAKTYATSSQQEAFQVELSTLEQSPALNLDVMLLLS